METRFRRIGRKAFNQGKGWDGARCVSAVDALFSFGISIEFAPILAEAPPEAPPLHAGQLRARPIFAAAAAAALLGLGDQL